MPTPRPKAHTFSIFIVCAIAVAATAWYVYKKTGQVATYSNSISVETPAPRENNVENVAGSDWESSFFANNTAGSVKTAEPTSKSSESSVPLSSTDKFGQAFFARYLELKQSGLTTNTEAVSNLINQTIVDSATLSRTEARVYTESNIKVSSDNSSIALQNYGNMVADILKKYAPTKNEAVIAKESLEKEDPQMLKQIDEIISSYQRIISEMLAVNVPSLAVKYHLAFINSISLMKNTAEALATSDSDPVRALGGLSNYMSGAQKYYEGLQSMRSFFANAGITYSNTEAGVIFNSNGQI